MKRCGDVFWTRKMSPGVNRAIYFTSTVCDAPAMHQIKLKLRNFDLDPHVILEQKKLQQRRQNILRDAQIIEKPKGVKLQCVDGAIRRCHDG